MRVSYPFLGIGIAFREVSDDNRVRLHEMVRSLLPTARVGVLTAPTASGNSTPAVSQTMVADPAAALQAVVEFFEARQLLTKEEFIALLQESH